jgi:hypothetical protein
LTAGRPAGCPALQASWRQGWAAPRPDAGLTQGTLAAELGLLVLVLGTAIVKWYDRKQFYRLHPDLLVHVSKWVQD